MLFCGILYSLVRELENLFDYFFFYFHPEAASSRWNNWDLRVPYTVQRIGIQTLSSMGHWLHMNTTDFSDKPSYTTYHDIPDPYPD